MIKDHPFRGGRLAQHRCAELTDGGETVCGAARAEHTSSRVSRVRIDRAGDIYSATTSVAGIDLALTADGRALIRSGARDAHPIPNLDTLIGHLELLRRHQKRAAAHPEFYRPGELPLSADTVARSCCIEFARTGYAHTEVCCDMAEDPRAD